MVILQKTSCARVSRQEYLFNWFLPSNKYKERHIHSNYCKYAIYRFVSSLFLCKTSFYALNERSLRATRLALANCTQGMETH